MAKTKMVETRLGEMSLSWANFKIFSTWRNASRLGETKFFYRPGELSGGFCETT